MSTISSIPNEIISFEIFPFLSSWEDVRRASGVCKDWSLCAEPEKVKRVKAFCFGLKDWKKYYGCDVEKTPLPKNMWKILTSPCPFWSKKQVRETHMLILVPKTVNGGLLTLKTLQELILHAKEGQAMYNCHSYKKFENKSVPKSYWALITKDVLPNSRQKNYPEQKKLIKRPYAVPGVLEMATGILVHHVKSGEKLYSDSPDTYTRCKEKISDGRGRDYPLVVGSFGASGLRVFTSLKDSGRSEFDGLCCLRKF